MRLDVYAFGSALMDIQVRVKDSVLDGLGITKGNMCLAERDQQETTLKKLLGAEQLLAEQLEKKLQLAAGGSAANTVFGVAQLGGRAGLCGKVAQDSFGDLYAQHMKSSGVVFNDKKVPGMTGTCIVLISDDAQRTMQTCLGVSSEIAYEDIDEEHLKQSAYLYLEGYLFDSVLATKTIYRAIKTARENKVKIALTASDAFCVARHKEIFLKLIKDDVDLLFANAQEAQALTDTDSNAAAVKALSGLCKNIAVTDGGNGSILCFDGRILNIQPSIVSPLDTTGAGDSYAAGLLYGITNGYSLESSGAIASFFASRVVSQIGPRYSGEIKQEIKSLKLEKKYNGGKESMLDNLPQIKINPKTFLREHCCLPALPKLVREIQDILQSDNAELTKVAGLISSDPSLVAQLLKVVNSAYYSLPRAITEVRYAIAFLGLNEVYRMVLALSVINTLAVKEKEELEKFWFHSFFASLCTKHLANKYEPQLSFEELWSASILHDIGKLVYLKFYPDHYKVIQNFVADNGCLFSEAEEHFSVPSSSYLGGLLCSHWRLPIKVKEACEVHTMKDLLTIKGNGPSESFKRMICLGNLTAILAGTPLNNDKKPEIAKAITVGLECSESDFLSIMAEIYNLRLEVENFMEKFT